MLAEFEALLELGYTPSPWIPVEDGKLLRTWSRWRGEHDFFATYERADEPGDDADRLRHVLTDARNAEGERLQAMVLEWLGGEKSLAVVIDAIKERWSVDAKRAVYMALMYYGRTHDLVELAEAGGYRKKERSEG